MSTTEAVLEEALETGEEIMDALESTAVLSAKHLIAVGILAGGVGATAAYFITKKRLTTKYEALAKAEIAEAKKFYRALNKQDEFATPESTVETLQDRTVTETAEVLLQYQGRIEEDVDPEDDTVVEVTENVFVKSVADDTFDLEEEMKTRTPDAPYVISQEEYLQGEPEFSQASITYYEGDGTLADEQDQEIPYIDPIVGTENLERFGQGSGDPRVVYIRNERLSSDFEVLRHDGKFAHEVLGFEHSDGGARGRRQMNQRRRFKGDDE